MINPIKLPAIRRIPRPALSRLSRVYGLLLDFEDHGETVISSREIGRMLGEGSHTVRKDISYLGESGTSGLGYNVAQLRSRIAAGLGLDRPRRTCVVGLGGLGLSFLDSQNPHARRFDIIAGFDSSINRLETVRTNIPVFASREIVEVSRRMNIELAILTGPVQAQENARRLIDGGVRGILNFSPAVIHNARNDVFISQIDPVGELRFLSALISLSERAGTG
jgi:redox-sensing transcriptional repressor